MGKKIPLLLSTLIIGGTYFGGELSAAPSTYAYDVSASAVESSLLPAGTEIDGMRYWSVSEMQQASELINAKREEFCAGDQMCMEELPWQQMEELGGIYFALDPFDNIQFMLTSINPSQNKVKFLYHDEDRMLSRMFGEKVRHNISLVYALWVDESLGDPTVSMNWLAYEKRAPYHLGSVEEVEAATHLIFDESESELGVGWFTPNIEHEYQVSDGNLADNTKSWLYYTLVTDEGGHTLGTIDYSSCINSPDYTDGMECRMMYREDGLYTYIPFEPTRTISATYADLAAVPEGNGVIDKNTTPEVTTNTIATTTPSAEPIGSTAKTEVASAPNTGKYTREESGAAEFPWWLFAIFGAGIAALLWLFWPKKSKKVKKSPKNILTKKSKCDKMVSV